jgi:hypothetical protein
LNENIATIHEENANGTTGHMLLLGRGFGCEQHLLFVEGGLKIYTPSPKVFGIKESWAMKRRTNVL